MNAEPPHDRQRGPYQGDGLIGEITESIHRHLLEAWPYDRPLPRLEEDLSFKPKDREEVVYVYMYKVAQNSALKNAKRWRQAKVTVGDDPDTAAVFYERPPLYLDLHYMVAVHSRFRSDAERLLGWLLLRLNEATHLVYRPRKYTLPDRTEVDSNGHPWSQDATGEDLIMEKVSVALIDDLTVGDAVNFFTIHEAPYRPFLTYQARCAMEGALVAAQPTIVRSLHGEVATAESSANRSNGRARLGASPRPTRGKTPFGPEGREHRPLADRNDNED